jgi:hypothetical protein
VAWAAGRPPLYVGLARFGPTTPKPFGAKHRTCPHSVVHVPHDVSLAVTAAEMGDAIRCSWSATLPEERRRPNRSFPTRCRTRPRPVPSGAAWPVNASALRSGTIGAGGPIGRTGRGPNRTTPGRSRPSGRDGGGRRSRSDRGRRSERLGAGLADAGRENLIKSRRPITSVHSPSPFLRTKAVNSTALDNGHCQVP